MFATQEAMAEALGVSKGQVAKMIKASALASVVTLLDLMGTTNLIYSRTFDFHIYLVAAVAYLVMVEGLRWLAGAIERHLARHIPASAGR